MKSYPDLQIQTFEHVTRVEIARAPHNFFDVSLIEQLGHCFESLQMDAQCRVIVLASQGSAFCAGGRLIEDANAEHSPLAGQGDNSPLYLAAVRLFRISKPIIAEVQGAAIGGGLGLSLVADFRVASPNARFAANFVKLGIHPGFGISVTLPRVIGQQKAHWMLMTGRRIKAEQAYEWGLVDELVGSAELRERTMALAAEIAEGAPLAVMSTRATQRQGLADAVENITRHEFAEQQRLAATQDFAEGLQAVQQRRPGNFQGR